jgi:hypothetical protein
MGAPDAAIQPPRGGPTYGWKVCKATEDSAAMPKPPSRPPRCGVLLVLAALLAGCAGPRTELMPKAEALKDARVMRVQVVKVYNNERMEHTTEFHVSHVVDVDVLEGPDELVGKPLTLPYDIFYVAKPPPAAGEVVVMAPADWVKRNTSGKARGFGQ